MVDRVPKSSRNLELASRCTTSCACTRRTTMFAGPQWANTTRPKVGVALQTAHARPSVPFVPLLTLAGSLHAAHVRFRTLGVPLRTTIVNRQTGLVGQQTALGNGLFTGSSFR